MYAVHSSSRFLPGVVFRITKIIILIFLAHASWAQREVVVVTQLQQVIRLSPAWRSVLNEESFPGNLQKDSLWNGQVVQRTKQLVGEKWNGAQVIFQNGEKVQFSLTSQALMAPPAITSDRNQGTYFIAIIQGISLTTTSVDASGMPVRNFTNTCMVKAEDKNGKVVWESRVIVPFSTVAKPGTIYGQAEISKEDLARLFEISLKNALESQSKRVANQIFYRPSIENPQWGNFLTRAIQAVVLEEVPDCAPRKGEARQSQFMFKEAKQKQAFELRQQFIGNAETPSGIILTKGQVKNMVTSQEYQVIAELSLPADREASPEERKKTPVSIRCTAEGLVAGRFTLSNGHFEGQWGYEVYSFRKILPKNTLEIRLNDKLVALIQRGRIAQEEGRKVRAINMLLNADLSDNEKADLYTILLVYQMAYALGQDYLEY